MVAFLYFSWVERSKLKKGILNCVQECEGALLSVSEEGKTGWLGFGLIYFLIQ